MKISNLVIVGGGTSGWLAAAYLYKNNPSITITVVDKEVGNPIGVGEATFLSFKPFMEECGFDIDEWFTEVDAGYKSGIMFTEWSEPGHEIWHPFYKGRRMIKSVPKDISTHDLWTLCQDLDFKKYGLSYYESSKKNTVDTSNLVSYGYHVDCGKLTIYIQNKLKDKINIIRSDVVNVVNQENGDIAYLELKNGSNIAGDLFLDCTGFKNILRKPTKRVDLQDRLFVNTALAHPVQYQNRDEEFKPYAVCEAVDHGWIWKIGVASRIGSGLVFNRNVTDIEEAKDYFVAHWDNRISKESIRVIDWTPFYYQDQWYGNVVSIGLGAGFIEPLESTGIGLITAAVAQVNNAIQEQYYTLDHVDFFNLQMKLYFEDSIDFVSMHYANSKRTSKFWNWVKEKFTASDRMNHFLEKLKDPKEPIPTTGKFNGFFGGNNWFLLLVQLGYPVAKKDIHINDESAREILIKNYVEWEKYKHVWSRHHASDVNRIREISKL